MLIKPHYRRVIREIMAEYGIPLPVVQPNFVVRRDASLECVVQHTDVYVGKGNALFFTNARPHYRYHNYIGTLRWLNLHYPTFPERRVANVDIGCGAGLFSWVFLDWAKEKGVGLDRVDLYGLDHSPAMLDLAGMVRNKLIQQIASYPELHYREDVDALIRELKGNYREGTDYIITFGHVLVQAQSSSDIDSFTRIIVYVCKLMDAQSNCVLVAVDASAGDRPTRFAAGWNSLLDNLEHEGIQSDPATPIGNSAKLTRLYSG